MATNLTAINSLVSYLDKVNPTKASNLRNQYGISLPSTNVTSPTAPTPTLSSLTAAGPKAPVYNTMTLTDAASSWNPLSLQGDGGGMAGELNGGINAPAYQAYLAQQAKIQQFQNQVIPNQYKDSPYASYFSNVSPLDYEQSKYQFFPDGGYSTADEGGMYHNIEKTNQLDYLDAYKKISAAPITVSVQDLLKLNPQAANFSPEVQKAFADNYRLGYASLYKPVYGDNVMPTSQGNINLLKDGKSDYWAIDPANLSKTYWDPKLGLQIDKKYVVEPVRNNFINTIAPIMASVVAPGVGTALGSALGITSPTISSAIAGAGLGGLTSGLSGGNPLTGALTGGIGGAITGSGVLDSILSPTNPVTAGSSAISGAGNLAGNITSDVLNGASTAAGSGVSGAFNLSQLAQDPSSILHVGDTDNMLSGTSLTSGNSGITGLTQGGSGIGLTNAASTGGAVASDVLGAGGASAITAADGLGGLASSLGGGLVGTAGGIVPAATAAAASAADFSVPDFLSNLFNTGATNFMKDPVKNTGTLLSGLVSYLQGKGQAGDLSNLLKNSLAQADPFGSQRAYYAQKLKDTYTNPVGVQKSPEYQAVHARELDALERADAAQGRRSQYGARAEKMDQNFMEYLNKERSTLAGLAGSGISPSQVANLSTTLGVGSSNAQVNSTGQLMFALNQLLNGGK